MSNDKKHIDSDTAVVMHMGCNDGDYMANEYISYMNEKATEWTGLGASVCFVTVSPINDAQVVANGYIEIDAMVVLFTNEIWKVEAK